MEERGRCQMEEGRVEEERDIFRATATMALYFRGRGLDRVVAVSSAENFFYARCSDKTNRAFRRTR